MHWGFLRNLKVSNSTQLDGLVNLEFLWLNQYWPNECGEY